MNLAYADLPKDENKIIACGIGEASNQDYEGLLAVFCAIRNRNSLKGVYGCNSKHVDREPKWVWDMARKAWRESKEYDVTCGATNWENTKNFGIPKWAKNMIVTYRCGDHVFFAAKNRRENDVK